MAGKAKPNQAQSSPIKADKGADDHEKAQGAQNENEVSWSQDGYLDWVEEQQHLEEVDVKSILNALKGKGGTHIQETALRLAASQICHLLKGFKIQKDPEDLRNLPPIANCLAKLSRGVLEIEKFKENVAEQKRKLKAEAAKTKPRRVLTKKALREMEKKLKLL